MVYNQCMRDPFNRRPFFFVADCACLDFVNTQVVLEGRPVDLLGNFGDWIAWLVQAGLIGADIGSRAMRKWEGRPAGKLAFEKALVFRSVLTRMAERIVRGGAIEDETIGRINELFCHGLGYTQVVRAATGFAKRVAVELIEPGQLVFPLAESAANLLCGSDLALVKKCGNPQCVLYFYDTTKNHARRWCSMSICGNRMKVAAYYRRSHSR